MVLRVTSGVRTSGMLACLSSGAMSSIRCKLLETLICRSSTNHTDCSSSLALMATELTERFFDSGVAYLLLKSCIYVDAFVHNLS